MISTMQAPSLMVVLPSQHRHAPSTPCWMSCAAGRSFFVWGKLLMAAGRISPLLRRALLCFYIVFLLAMILVVLPVSVILKKLLHPLLKGRLKKLADYYGQPSGR